MVYTLFNDHRKIKAKEEQLNTKDIGQVFGLYPDSIYLICEDGSLETPCRERGIFSDLKQYYKYEVCGLPLSMSPKSQLSSTSTPLTGAGLPSTSTCPGASVASLLTGRPRGVSSKTRWPARPPGVNFAKEEWTKNVEVCNYSKSLGGLRKFSNFPITLTESTSSIDHVSQQLSVEAFGGQNVILLDNDNLKIPDTSASRGTKFWRSNKKIKAVTEKDYSELHGIIVSDSDDDFESYTHGSLKKEKRHYSPIHLSSSDDDKPCTSKGKGSTKIGGRVKLIEDRLAKLEGANPPEASERNSEVNYCAMISEIKELFKCFICKSILCHELSLMSCCHQLACSSCLDQWAASNTSDATCPLCRAVFHDNSQSSTLPRSLFLLLDILRKTEMELH